MSFPVGKCHLWSAKLIYGALMSFPVSKCRFRSVNVIFGPKRPFSVRFLLLVLSASSSFLLSRFAQLIFGVYLKHSRVFLVESGWRTFSVRMVFETLKNYTL